MGFASCNGLTHFPDIQLHFILLCENKDWSICTTIQIIKRVLTILEGV